MTKRDFVLSRAHEQVATMGVVYDDAVLYFDDPDDFREIIDRHVADDTWWFA